MRTHRWGPFGIDFPSKDIVKKRTVKWLEKVRQINMTDSKISRIVFYTTITEGHRPVCSYFNNKVNRYIRTYVLTVWQPFSFPSSLECRPPPLHSSAWCFNTLTLVSQSLQCSYRPLCPLTGETLIKQRPHKGTFIDFLRHRSPFSLFSNTLSLFLYVVHFIWLVAHCHSLFYWILLSVSGCHL